MISGDFLDLGLNCGLGHVRTRPDPYWPIHYKGSIRGQGSNFGVGLWSRWVAIHRFTLSEKSIGDGPRSPKRSLEQIRDQIRGQ